MRVASKNFLHSEVLTPPRAPDEPTQRIDVVQEAICENFCKASQLHSLLCLLSEGKGTDVKLEGLPFERR